MKYTDVERVLETYTFTEILELNELDTADVLLYLVETDFLQLPDPMPVILDD